MRVQEKESDILKSILQYLKLKGVFCWRVGTGAFPIEDGAGKRRFFRSGMRGVSDIIGIYKRHFIATEVKRPGGKLSVYQQAFLNEIERHGGISIVAMCIDDVESVFRDMNW